jgi:hypothetical protein
MTTVENLTSRKHFEERKGESDAALAQVTSGLFGLVDLR